jgi:type IX secretion system substrate protein
MKKLKILTVIIVLLCTGIAMPQNHLPKNNNEIDVKKLHTPELKVLYEKARLLENATPHEINANRIALRQAWENINLDWAQLYKPIKSSSRDSDFAVEINSSSKSSLNPQIQNERWADDIQIHNLRIDGGVDIVSFNEGETLYASSFNNNAGGDYYINIFQSTDQGETWQNFRSVSIGVPTLKMKTLAMEGTNSGDKYLLIYYINQNNTFRVLRWNLTAGESFEGETITNDVVDFAVDRNWTAAADNQRVFAVYKKTNNELYSARTNAGTYGFTWVDETYLNNNRGQVDIAYGRNGSVYVVMVSDATGSMYVRVNDNYNDPASWSTSDLLENGADKESMLPTISAERLDINNDNVLVVASSRDAGTSGKYNLRRYIRNNGADFDAGTTEGSPAGISYLFFDSFINYRGGSNIHLGMVEYFINGSENNKVYHRFYNGGSLSGYNLASSENLNVFSLFFKPYGLTSITTSNGEEPMMVFCGTSADGTHGEGLYFDKESNILSTVDFDKPQISIYPNPAQNQIEVLLPKEFVTNLMTIYDTTGKVIRQQKFKEVGGSLVIDISFLNDGLYFLRFETGNGIITEKIIKN